MAFGALLGSTSNTGDANGSSLALGPLTVAVADGDWTVALGAVWR